MGWEPKFVTSLDPVLDFINEGHMDERLSFTENLSGHFKIDAL